MIERPSPNFDPRPEGAAVDMLVLHYTGMISRAAALARLCEPSSRVSAHYTIDEDGTVYRLVDEGTRAWHAGEAFWAGATDVNSRSIGIELVNPGHEFGYRPFPAPQMAALEELAGAIVARHPIPPDRVLGHSDVAPHRKCDPGELFDWQRLAVAGIGLWPRGDGAAPGGEVEMAAVELLAGYGYRVAPGEQALRQAVIAFQRHFRPRRVDGTVDGETLARLAELCAQRAQPAQPAQPA